MGIQGLLPQLRSIMHPIHAQDLRGQTVAVDTYSWLHKGAISCSLQLCKGIPTTRHIEYCMHRVKLLQHHGVKPVLVFDGGLLPMKIDQETKRARKRKENLERALEHEAAGNSGAAFDCYQKAVDISPSIAFELIKVLKQEKVDYIVAPYEADAQMTFMSIYKHVDAVITEDSDLIPFGCSRVIFKMDKFGQGVEFRSSMLEQNRDLDFARFTKQMILEMCILSGCDYLPSLPGMGLKRAHALIQRYKSYDKVTKHLRYSGASIPPLYEESFRKALWAFQYQRVYDPEKECIVHLSDVPQGIGEDLEFLGPWLPPDVAKAIANGDLDPLTKMPFQVETASAVLFVDKMFSTKRFEPIGRGKRLNLPVQKNILTNYFCLASIEAKRKFRAPKFMPKHLKESASPCRGCDDLDSPGSDEMPLSSITNQSQDSLRNSRDLEDELPVKVSMEDRLLNRCNEFLEFPSHGSSLLELHHNSDEPFLKSHEDHEAESKHSSLGNKQSVKRNIITRSPFFHNNSVHEVAAGDPNEVSWKKEYDNVLDDYPVSTDESMQTSFRETPIKKRKAEAIHLHEESLPLGNLKSTSATSGQGKHISSSSEIDDVKTKNFLRDISHVNDYCVIAEKSMDRFVSLMNSFRHNSSGSRASGLRAPLKDVRNTFSISSNKAPVDFSDFSYKPSKRPAQMVSSRSKID